MASSLSSAVGVAVAVGMAVGVGVALGSGVGVAVGVTVGVRVTMGACVKVGAAGVSVGMGVCVLVGVDVIVGVAVSVGMSVVAERRRQRRQSICRSCRVSSGWYRRYVRRCHKCRCPVRGHKMAWHWATLTQPVRLAPPPVPEWAVA